MEELMNGDLENVNGGSAFENGHEWNVRCNDCAQDLGGYDTKEEANQAIAIHKAQTNHQEYWIHQYVPGLF